MEYVERKKEQSWQHILLRSVFKVFTIVGDNAGIPTTRCGGSPAKGQDHINDSAINCYVLTEYLCTCF